MYMMIGNFIDKVGLISIKTCEGLLVQNVLAQRETGNYTRNGRVCTLASYRVQSGVFFQKMGARSAEQNTLAIFMFTELSRDEIQCRSALPMNDSPAKNKHVYK